MTTAEVWALAFTNGVRITTALLGFGHGVEATATYKRWSETVTHIDPDRAVVQAIEALAWSIPTRTGDALDGPMGWAFDVFDVDGCFPVEASAMRPSDAPGGEVGT